MHSGQGDEASENTYRPMPLPDEPRPPAASEVRQGVVFPAHGDPWQPPAEDRWAQPGADATRPATPGAQPAAGRPWGEPQPTPPQPDEGAEATRLLTPYGSGTHAGAPQQQGFGAAPTSPVPPAAPGFGEPQGYVQLGHPDQPSYTGQPPYTGQPEHFPQGGHPAQPQHPGQQAPDAAYGDPYGGGPRPGSGDAEKTQLIPPYTQHPLPPLDGPAHLGPGGVAGDGDKTQLMAPYREPSAALPAQPEELRQPLPPEQSFAAPVPPLPQGPPPAGARIPAAVEAPMPGAAPYAIRPGTPDEHPPPAYGNEPAPVEPTQQLPRFTDSWDQGPQGPHQGQGHGQGGAGFGAQEQGQAAPDDDYDYLYRRDDEPPRQPAPQAPQAPAAYDRMPGHGGPHDGGPGANRYDGGGYDGGRYDDGPRRKKPSPVVLVGVGVAVLAVVGVGAGALLSGGGSGKDQQPAGATSSAGAGSSGGSDAAQAQAKQLDGLLQTSDGSRTAVINAVASIKTCSNLGTSASDLRTAAGQRDDLVTKLSHMDLGQLPDHAELVSQLTIAWKASAAADKHYAAWADEVAGKKGCQKGHAKSTVEAQRGNASSGEATLAKKRAADLWNPIAQRYGLTQRQYTQL
ncbi:hypothetical protein K7472_08475 [Streptomyces sp. PTM05]|uniref:Uncharacterized protein n=1 Tax=Streptantibioticus parmotrematis TaxID=2873249 RepID=A0ABS7QSS6_9ACTN|nr:hypothetical protein [Streptantibioticus parmotrematis]MBY8884882.1 hypothetical protein [Streptantibioticus parmotrematis]